MVAKRIAAAASAALVVGTLTLETPHAQAASSGSCWSHKVSEKRLARKLNRARARHGRRRLRLDPQLSQVARRHSRTMGTLRTLFHDFAKLKRRVTRWEALGENVGVGSAVKRIHRAFMSSTKHRSNVMWRPFRHVGVGVRRAGGRMWVTVVCESRRDPGTALPSPC